MLFYLAVSETELALTLMVQPARANKPGRAPKPSYRESQA